MQCSLSSLRRGYSPFFKKSGAIFFKHSEETSPNDLKKLIGNDDIIEKVYHELDRFYWNEQELLDYESTEKAKKDFLACMRKQFEDGEIEGIAKGRAEERVKAEQEKAELQAKAELTVKEMARHLRSQDISTSVIRLTTKLSEEEIESL